MIPTPGARDEKLSGAIDTGDKGVYNQVMIYRATLIFMIVVLTWGGPYGQAFELLGVEIPVPDRAFEPIEGENIPASRYPLEYNLHFFLNESGRVDSFQYWPDSRPVYIENIRGSLENLEFHPAIRDGKTIPFIVPASITFETKYGRPGVRFQFPVDETECRKDRFLLDSMMFLNDYRMPGLAGFPSYYCRFSNGRDTGMYPYVVYRVDLDTAGDLVDYEKIFIGKPDFTAATDKALLYARFTPTVAGEIKIPSKIYLTIRFFPSILYPTREWLPPESSGDRSLPELFRLETAAYLDSIINPPFPINIQGGQYHNTELIQFSDTVDVTVGIRNNGRVKSVVFEKFLMDPLENQLYDVVRKLRFTPAVDTLGNRVDYLGKMKIIVDGSKKIRIGLGWFGFGMI
nr:hypothetical protein [candidate division Zixibacteria bacterium]